MHVTYVKRNGDVSRDAARIAFVLSDNLFVESISCLVCDREFPVLRTG